MPSDTKPYMGAIVKGMAFIMDYGREDAEELVRVADVQPADDVCCKVRLAGTTWWEPEFQFRRRATPLPTPTDTDTAIPAGEVTRAMEQAFSDAREDWSTRSGLPMNLSFAWPHILAAASSKPDTDTPVDPGVEGVRDIVRRMVWSNTGCSDDAAERAADAIVAALAAKPETAR